MNLHAGKVKPKPEDIPDIEPPSLDSAKEKQSEYDPAIFQFKSPGVAMIHTLIAPGWGEGYALNMGQKVFPVTGILLGLGAGSLIAGSAGIAGDALIPGGAAMLGSAYLCDYIAGAVISADNAVAFINYAKKTEMQISGEKQFYREPVLAAALSLFSAGAGRWYAGENENTVLIASIDLFLGYVCPVVWLSTPQGDDPVHWVPGMLMIGAVAFRAVNLAYNVFFTDRTNEEYFKQTACPNSEYSIVQNNDRREPSVAVTLAALLGGALPGIGNLYAGNPQAAFTLFAIGTAGWATALLAPGISGLDDNSKSFYFGVGVGAVAFSYLYDVVSAPCNAEIHNAVFCGAKRPAHSYAPILTVYPSLVDRSAGLNVACAF